jgi:hypothetical protein
LLTLLILVGVKIAANHLLLDTASWLLQAKILTALLMVAPAGFVMGWMMPIGMNVFASGKNSSWIPWLWAVNGFTSVMASMLAAFISMGYGINASFWVGVAAYLCCSLILFFERGKSKTSGAALLHQDS